ncbi:alkaline phosphatase family protein [Sphingopyxis sp. MWB1]|uniref:alkaline phosphatase family protein n=1 Tax=Sphingopyxis sp. MWB1 TaxID=1537715 RepID=UPI00068F3D52|nr:alkaline phosphatase family protein [Sphingopyxis sp. MWB1]
MGQEAAAPIAPAVTAATPAPKLLVVIAVDQFSADLFAEYRGRFTGGLARLASGVVFPAGYQAHGATETCPGHSTILTGNHPAHTGIIANQYYDLSAARADKRIYCAEDERVPGTTSKGDGYAPSVEHLLVPTLGDLMKARNPRAQVVSVAGKDRAAIMMGGRKADELMWLSPKGLTSYRGTALSPTAQKASAAIAAALAQPREAMPLPLDCLSHDIAIPLGNGATVGTGRMAREAGDYNRFRASPEADGAVLATAAALRAARKMGEGDTTDLLIVGLSATDYVGHGTGTEGTEMCLQMAGLDRELDDFFKQLDATGIDYLVALTADHGGHDLPERNRQNAWPDAQRVDRALDPDVLGKQVAEKLNLPQPLLYGVSGDYYLSKALTAQQRKAALAEILPRLRAHPQVEAVVTKEELAAHAISKRAPDTWTLMDKLRASWHPDRSGDFIIALKPRITPIAEPGVGYVATHGSVWDYDRRVPILFWRKGLAAFEQPNAVMTVDILPTLAALIDLPVDEAKVDGRCLDLVSGPGSSCR